MSTRLSVRKHVSLSNVKRSYYFCSEGGGGGAGRGPGVAGVAAPGGGRQLLAARGVSAAGGRGAVPAGARHHQQGVQREADLHQVGAQQQVRVRVVMVLQVRVRVRAVMVLQVRVRCCKCCPVLDIDQ